MRAHHIELPRWPLASLASAARADEPCSSECPARALVEWPRWPLASLASAALAAAATLMVAVPVRAGGDKIAFPEDYAKGALYTTLDRPDNKQYRELFVTPASALDAAKKGEPLPSGTVLTLVQYAAKLDPQGNPEKDANGRFIKTNIVAYTVMEKRAGWGTEYPDNVRNGEWEYQAFKADKTPNTAANLTACFNCHKPLDKQDFVFSYDKLQAAAK